MDLTRTCGPGNLSWPIHGPAVPLGPIGPKGAHGRPAGGSSYSSITHFKNQCGRVDPFPLSKKDRVAVNGQGGCAPPRPPGLRKVGAQSPKGPQGPQLGLGPLGPLAPEAAGKQPKTGGSGRAEPPRPLTAT